MNKSLAAVVALAFAGTIAAPAHAQSGTGGTSARTEQQSRMASCNKQASGKKGAERKAFMKDCLGGKAAGDTPATASKSAADSAQGNQQGRMRECNAQAKGKKGDDRKAFMKECLSGTRNATIAPQSQSNKSKPALESPKP